MQAPLNVPGSEIACLASQMRTALEQFALTAAKTLYPPCWDQFPMGCCGDASNLLAAYLADHGFNDCVYVVGKPLWSEGGSHAWIERDGLIIDITVDQFAGKTSSIPASVFVSHDRTWHDTYCVNQGHHGEANFQKHVAPPFSLVLMYSKLQPYL